MWEYVVIFLDSIGSQVMHDPMTLWCRFMYKKVLQGFNRSILHLVCKSEAKNDAWLGGPCFSIQNKILLRQSYIHVGRAQLNVAVSKRGSRCLPKEIPRESSTLIQSSCWRYFGWHLPPWYGRGLLIYLGICLSLISLDWWRSWMEPTNHSEES